MSNKQTSKHILGTDLGTDCELESMMEEGKVFLLEFCSNRMGCWLISSPKSLLEILSAVVFSYLTLGNQLSLLQNQTEEEAAAAEGAACSPYENPLKKE